MIRDEDVALTESVTEMTTENGENSVPIASQVLNTASEFKIEAALQLLSETSDALLETRTHNGANTVLPDESDTRAENVDSCMLPVPERSPVMLFKNRMFAGDPASTRNVFD